MIDYIKRDDAIKAFDPKQRRDWYTPWIVEELKDLPSEDVAPIVRCKDCKHYEYSDRLERLVCGYHRGWRFGMNENDFCSYGERKDDE